MTQWIEGNVERGGVEWNNYYVLRMAEGRQSCWRRGGRRQGAARHAAMVLLTDGGRARAPRTTPRARPRRRSTPTHAVASARPLPIAQIQTTRNALLNFLLRSQGFQCFHELQ